MPHETPCSLYYNEKSTTRSYTTVPTGDLDISRLPKYSDYWISDAGTRLKPKTLILADWTAIYWPEHKVNQVCLVLHDLLSKGFSIYLWSSQKLTKLSTEHLNKIKNFSVRQNIVAEQPNVLKNKLVAQYKVPIDQIMVLDPFLLSWAMGNQAKAPQGVLGLSYFIRSELFRRPSKLDDLFEIIKKSPCALRAIVYDTNALHIDCSDFLVKLNEAFPHLIVRKSESVFGSFPAVEIDGTIIKTADARVDIVTLKEVRALNISFKAQVHASNEHLSNILSNLPALEHLNIEANAEEDDQLPFSNGQELIIPELPKLMLFYSALCFSLRQLNSLLNAASNLQILTVLVHNAEDSGAELNIESLPLLYSLTLDAHHQIGFNIKPLTHLLDVAPNLKTLKLNGNFIGMIDALGELPQIEVLELKRTTLSWSCIQRLLNAMPQLNKLLITSCSAFSNEFNLEPESLLRLDELDLSSEKLGEDNEDVDGNDEYNDDSKSLITYKKLEQLLKAAPNIQKLFLMKCSNLSGASSSLENLNLEPNTLRKLTYIDASLSSITSENLEHLLASAPNIEELFLSACDNLGGFNPLAGSLKQLKSVNLDNSFINSHSLQALLAAAPNIEELTLSQCSNISQDFNLSRDSLKQLRRVDLTDTPISSQSLGALLAAAPNIEALYLVACTELSDPFNPLADSLKQLRSIDLTDCFISAQWLQVLLANASNIKDLVLSNCESLSGGFSLEPNSLDKLQSIYAPSSSMTINTLKTLLMAASKIKGLNLDGCSELLSGTLNLEPNSLMHLESINMACSCSTKTLECLLRAAPHLKKITVLNSKDKSIQREVNALLAQYPNIHITKLAAYPLAKRDKEEDKDVAHDRSRFFEPQDIPEPGSFKFKGVNRSKSQKMIIEKLSQYLHLIQRDSEIDALQMGICNALSHYFLHKPIDHFESILTNILEWDGNLNSLPSWGVQPKIDDDPQLLQWIVEANQGLVSVFTELIGYTHRYQKLEQQPPQYLGNHLMDYLTASLSLEGAVFTNPWHSIAIKPLNENKFLIYDPNYINGPKTVDASDLSSVIQSALGSLVGVISSDTQQLPLISDWNAFIGEGGLLTILQSHNAPNFLHQVPQGYEHSDEALKGILLLSTSNVPAWVIGLKSEYSAYTAALLKQFVRKNPQSAYLKLKQSMVGLAEEDKAYFLNYMQQLPHVAAQMQAEKASVAQQTLGKKLESRYESYFETWNAEKTVATGVKKFCHRITSATTSTRLIKLKSQDEVSAVLLAIERHCAATSRPVYYIHSPDDLVCSAPYIHPIDSQYGELKKGPGGRLHDFITQQKRAIILVNYSTFSANDLVLYNALLDKKPFADGTALAAQTLVIGVINMNQADCYEGSDFYSRFEDIDVNPLSKKALKEAMPTDFFESKIDDVDDEDVDMESAKPTVINLFNSNEWRQLLLGRWVLNNDQLIFEEGALPKALRQHSAIELQNAPWDNAEFIHFWQRAYQRKVIDHDGGKITLPTDFALIKGGGYSWDLLCSNLELCNEHQDDFKVLNPHEYRMFFTHYQYNVQTQTLQNVDGWIKKSKGASLSVYLTRELSEDRWALLLDECAKHGVRLKLQVAHAVALPLVLAQASVADEPLSLIASSTHTQIIYSSDPDTTIAQMNQDNDWEVIDVSECKASDLIESIKPQFNEDGTLSFRFTQADGTVIDALKNNKKILLTGVYSKELEDILTALLIARAKHTSGAPLGKLCIVSADANQFQCLDSQKHEVTKEEKYACLGDISSEIKEALAEFMHEPLSSLKARCTFLRAHPERKSTDLWQGMYTLDRAAFKSTFDSHTSAQEARVFHEQRLQSVHMHLAQNPYVFLSGLSGVGKTTFVRTSLCTANDVFYEGEKAIELWARNSVALEGNGRHILFIDEATLSARQWSEFEGLFQTPRGILIQGKFYPLSEQHKVVFAGNPISYGDERQLASLFKRHGCALVFNPLPAAVLYEDVIKPIFSGTSLEAQASVLCEPFLKTYQVLLEAATDDVLISPRELQMMALLTLSYCQMHPEANALEAAQHHAFKLARPLVPKSFQSTFIDTIKDQALPQLDMETDEDDEPEFIMTSSRKPIYQQLEHLLALRECRQNGAFNKNDAQRFGGLGGFVIEGMPGVGKSEFITALLRAHDFKEKHYKPSISPLSGSVPMAKNEFYRMPVSMSYAEKTALLLKAFNEGALVICDEMNASPMMEQLINALLTGTTPEGLRPAHPGFMILGTQNPISLAGRRVASTALSRRMMSVELPPYPKEELVTILEARGLNKPEAEALSSVFIKKLNVARANGYSPEPTFRDLIRQADSISKGSSKKRALELREHSLEEEEPSSKRHRGGSSSSSGFFRPRVETPVTVQEDESIDPNATSTASI